jgi:hypothetical protein
MKIEIIKTWGKTQILLSSFLQIHQNETVPILILRGERKGIKNHHQNHPLREIAEQTRFFSIPYF